MDNKKISSYLLNCVVLFFIFILLIFSMKYSVIANDDMMNYIINHRIVYHGRFFTHAIQIFFIKYIPEILSIHVQDFAFISQAVLKSGLIVFLLNVISLSFFRFENKRIFLPLINIFSFLLFFAFIFKLKFMFGIETSAFFFGYVFTIPVFMLLWFMLSDIYVKNEVVSGRKLITFNILVILNAMSNEEYFFVTLFLLFCFLLHLKSIHSKFRKNVVILMIILIIAGIIIFVSNKGFSDIVSSYNLSYNFGFSKKEIFDFLYVYTNKLIYTVLFLWIPLIFGVLSIINAKTETGQRKKILLFLLYSFLAFFMFFAVLYILGPSFTYENYAEYYLFPRYWILHPGLLLCYYSFLIAANLYVAGYLFYIKQNKYCTAIILIFLLLSSGFICKNIKWIEISSKNKRQTLYILDKLSVFYFRQGKPAILPADNIELILPLYNNNMPKDLQDKTGQAYKNKIYKGYMYLLYIYITYKVNPKYGMSFKSQKEALDAFYKNGGRFKSGELKKLNFSYIKNGLKRN